MRRRSSLLWLTWRLATLYWKRWVPIVGIATTAAIIGGSAMASCSVVRVATFNIENFPKSRAQVDGAFKAIKSTGAEVVMVQEITQPSRFESEAKQRLGANWQLATAKGGNEQKVGVLFDGRRFAKKGQKEHRAVALYPGAKPALEVLLEDRRSKEKVAVFSVHLKAGGNAKDKRIRALQLTALGVILRKAQQQHGAVVVGGDFNATSDADHIAIASMAVAADLDWPTANIPCSAYYKTQGSCQTSQLDHVLNTGVGYDASAGGACGSVGCETRKSCPTWFSQVSDHCPVSSKVVLPH